MTSKYDGFISAVQNSNIEESIKSGIISSFQNIYSEQCSQYNELLNEKNNMELELRRKLTTVQEMLIEVQQKYISSSAPCHEKPQSNSTENVPMIDLTIPPPNIVPTKPTLIKENVTGVVYSFDINKRSGIIHFRNDQNDENLTAVTVHASNISKSKIVKPHLRTLQKNETVVFDLYDFGNGVLIAKNVTGPNNADVLGVIVKIIYRNAPHYSNPQTYRNPRQNVPEQRRPCQINSSSCRTPSRPRSTSTHRNQSQNYRRSNDGYQQVKNNFRHQRQY
jgi:hypothetical protein